MSTSLCVLVVDDNPDIASSLADLLNLLGYKVVSFTLGSKAVAEASSLHPDVALVDLGMPEMDGFQVAAGLKEVSPCTKLVACTAWGDSATRSQTKAAGFREHLVKPLDVGELEKTLETMGAAAPCEAGSP